MDFIIISDIHDHVDNLRAALRSDEAGACDALIGCGDLCSPFIIDLLDRHFEGSMHLVFGNNDGDEFLITRKAMGINEREEKAGRPPRFFIHGPFLLAGDPPNAGHPFGRARVAVNHYPALAGGLAKSGAFDLVLYGHDHRAARKRIGSCLLVNPGALMGWSPLSPDERTPATFAVWRMNPGEATVRDRDLEFYEISGGKASPIEIK